MNEVEARGLTEIGLYRVPGLVCCCFLFCLFDFFLLFIKHLIME